VGPPGIVEATLAGDPVTFHLTDRRPFRTALLTLGAVAVALSLQPAAAKERPVGKPVEYLGFYMAYSTGLRLVTYEVPGAPRASLGISWLAGSMDDPPGKEGLAHLVEHLAFRRRVAGGTVWQRLQSDGVAFNAFTTHDATVYHESGKPEQLRSLLSLEVLRMQQPLEGITQADFDTEREVVVSELRERNQVAGELEAHEVLQAHLFGAGHPYARGVGGTEASVRSITFADAKAFVDRLYRPERAIVTVISPQPARETARLAFDLLGPLANDPAGASTKVVTPARRDPVPVPPDPSPELATLLGPVVRPVVLVAFAVPGEAAEGRAMARAAAEAIQARLTGRLVFEGEYQKIAGISARYAAHDGMGSVVVRVELEAGLDPKEVVTALRDNLVSPSDDDLRLRARVAERSRDSQLTSNYLALENLNVGDLCEYVRATGKQDAIRGRQLQVVSLNQSLESYWHQYFKRSRSAAVVMLPDPTRPALSLAGGGLASRMEEQQSHRDLPFTPGRPVEELARPPGFDRTSRARLASGLSVVMVRRPLLPIVEATLVIPTDLAGVGGTSASMPGFAMDFAGTAADARWMHSSRLGARGRTAPGLESVTFTRSSSSATLQQLLEDLERLTHNFEFDFARARVIREYLGRSLQARLKRPSSVAEDAFRANLYPGHPYGHQESAAELERLNHGDAEHWVDRQIRPDQATLIVVGDIEPGEALLKQVTGIFGGWKAGRAAPPVSLAPPLPGEPRVLLFDRPGAKLTELKVGFRAPPQTIREGAAGDTVARRLGQTLQEALRVSAGSTYGVHVNFDELPQASTLVVQTAVDAAVSGDALVRILAGVEALAQLPLPEDALARVRWLVARDFSMEFDTVSQVSWALATSAARGLPPDYWEQQAVSIASLSSARVQTLARSLLGHEIVMVVGDARVVGPQLKDAGFDYQLLK
jgi:zinc protease